VKLNFPIENQYVVSTTVSILNLNPRVIDERNVEGFGIEPGSTAVAVVAERWFIGRHMKEIFHSCNLN
jgi:hypothetical protein